MKHKISRKEFIKISSAAALSVPLLGLHSCKSSNEKTNETETAVKPASEFPNKFADRLGIQLYTVRDAMETDAKNTLEKVAKVGYKELEAYDLPTLPEVKNMAEDLGMQIVACHTPVGYLTGTWEDPNEKKRYPADYSYDRVIEDISKLGITNIGVAYIYKADRQSLDDYKKIADLLNQAGEKAKAAGGRLYYHNHSFEFEPMENTTPWDEMIKILDPDLVALELDVFWSQIAHVNPAEVIRNSKGRVKFLHLKDLKKDTPKDYTTSDVDPEVFLPVGEGMVNFRAILNAAHENGVEYAFVEQDHAPNRDIFECIGLSYKHLIGLDM